MSMTWQLIKKDFFLYQNLVYLYASIALAAVMIMAIPNELAVHFGAIVMVFAMLSFYCHLVMKAVVIERKEQNHLFLMTLPISSRQLLTTKVTVILLMYVSIWALSYLAVLLLGLNSPHWSAGAPAFYSLMFFAYLPAFAVILWVAVATFSEGLSILTITLANMAVVLVLNFAPATEFMEQAFSSGTIGIVGVAWPSQVNVFIAAELGAFVLFVGLSYLAAMRRKTFTN